MAFGKLLRGVSKAVKSAAKVGNVPIVGNVLKAVPGVGTALSLAGAASGAMSLFGGGGGGGLPALPQGFSGGVPALPGGGAPAIVGDRSIFRDDPNIVAALQPFAISARNLKQYYRAPIKGYVIRRDQNGDPYGIPKHLAKKFLGYKSAKKPPISVGEWEAVKRADRTIKKVKKITATMTRVDKNIKGGKVVARKAKAK